MVVVAPLPARLPVSLEYRPPARHLQAAGKVGTDAARTRYKTV
jgi:hypothetical protein